MQATLPAPVGGLNARDAPSDMEPMDALIMDNMFPDTNGVGVRGGSQNHVTGFTGNVETLMEWCGPASQKFIAAVDNTFYDVSTTATVSVQATSMTSVRWQNTMFGTAGGNYLYVVNGQDKPRFYDGTTWTTSSLTATALSSNGDPLKYVMAHQQRLFFGQTNSLNIWYLPTNQIHGLCSRFPLENYARRGGHIVGVGSWTLDGGTGMDDMAVFLTSEGEAIVYSGTDPSSTSTWALKGVYTIPRPIGDRPLVKLGGDLIVQCEDGMYPLSKALIVASANPAVAISDKISGAVKSASATARTYFGWQGCLYPRGKMLIFNVPTTANALAQQFVMNTVTGAWCRFTNLNAFCWATFKGDLFFGATGKVMQADIGTDDAGMDITCDLMQAFSNFGQPVNKHWKMAKPVFTAQGRIIAAIRMCSDFESALPTSTPSYEPGGGTAWDDGDWDTFLWGGSDLVFQSWQSVGGIGIYGALRIKTSVAGFPFALVSTAFLYETGGSL